MIQRGSSRPPAQGLGSAQRPLICAGGGVLSPRGASDSLLQLAETLEAPVVMTNNARGSPSERHYLAQPPMAGKSLLPNADVVLAVGTRFVQPATQWGVGPEQTVIQIDVDADEIGRNSNVDVPIVVDAGAALTELVRRVDRYQHPRPSRREELTAVKARIEQQLGEIQPQAGSFRGGDFARNFPKMASLFAA